MLGSGTQWRYSCKHPRGRPCSSHHKPKGGSDRKRNWPDVVRTDPTGSALSCPAFYLSKSSTSGSWNKHARALCLLGCHVSEAGVLAKTYIERGMLVPDQVMTRLMLPKLEQLRNHSWLLDGKKSHVFATFTTVLLNSTKVLKKKKKEELYQTAWVPCHDSL